MSHEYGMAALNLEMTDRVPRTEYSADFHWDLISKVTGIAVTSKSDKKLQERATSVFVKEWNYDFYWNILTNHEIFGDFRTKMGHATYETDGVDFNNEVVCPFKEPEDVLKFDPYSIYGARDKKQLTLEYNEDYNKKLKLFPDAVNMTGIYVTCMSGLIEILGWDMLLMAAGIDPKGFGELTNRYTNWILQYFEALAASKNDIVMVHDDIVWSSGAFINPEWYRKYIFPNYKKLLAPLHEAGKKIIYTCDGDYTEFIDDMVEVGVNGFVLEPATNMNYIAEKYGNTHVFVGNADTRILLGGTKEDIENEVKRCMDIGKKYPGFFMAVGNHIPPNTPVDNALWYNEIYEKLSRR